MKILQSSCLQEMSEKEDIGLGLEDVVKWLCMYACIRERAHGGYLEVGDA